MFGDARPHEFADYKQIMENYPFVEDQLDWRDEADELKRQVGEFTDYTEINRANFGITVLQKS